MFSIVNVQRRSWTAVLEKIYSRKRKKQDKLEPRRDISNKSTIDEVVDLD